MTNAKPAVMRDAKVDTIGHIGLPLQCWRHVTSRTRTCRQSLVASAFDVSSMLDRGNTISKRKCCPWKVGEMLHTAAPRLSICVLLTHYCTLFWLFTVIYSKMKFPFPLPYEVLYFILPISACKAMWLSEPILHIWSLRFYIINV